jgi:hypothetical protein
METVMTRRLALTLLATLILSTTPFAQGSVAGGWDLTINGPQGEITATATVKQDGEKVTGTLQSPQGEVEMAGTMKGSTLAMAFSVQTPNGPLDIKLVAEVTGATLKGTIDFGMGTAELTGKKK